MPDPLIPTSAADVVEKVGLTIATIIGLVYVLKLLSQMHLKALNDRIMILEGVVNRRDQQIEHSQVALLEKTDRHAHEMKDIAIRLANEIRDNRAFNREQHAVLVRMLDKLDSRPCMMGEPEPHEVHKRRRDPRTSSSDELPSVPKTDTFEDRA